MTVDVEREEFVSGQFRTVPSHSVSSAVMRRARTHLWNVFHGTKMKAGSRCASGDSNLALKHLFFLTAVQMEGVKHDYLKHLAADVCNRYLSSHNV